MDECTNWLGIDAKFSTLNANYGYKQIEIDAMNRNKTAFTSKRSLFQFRKMPLGLHNALDKLLRAMDDILSSVKWKFASFIWTNNRIFENRPGPYIASEAMLNNTEQQWQDKRLFRVEK